MAFETQGAERVQAAQGGLLSCWLHAFDATTGVQDSELENSSDWAGLGRLSRQDSGAPVIHNLY